MNGKNIMKTTLIIAGTAIITGVVINKLTDGAVVDALTSMKDAVCAAKDATVEAVEDVAEAVAEVAE